MSNPEQTPEIKLYAGKYKTVEELEKGYNSSASYINEVKAQLSNYKVPDSYILPQDVNTHHEIVEEVKDLALSSHLSQAQFEAVLRTKAQKNQDAINKLEQARANAGDNLKLIEDYVGKTCPETIKHTVLNNILLNENAMKETLNRRNQTLNSEVPGVNSASSSAPVGNIHDDKQKMVAAYHQYTNNPNNDNFENYRRLTEIFVNNKNK